MPLFVRLPFLLAVLSAQPLLAQVAGLRSEIPEDIQRIRMMQMERTLGEVVLTFRDEGKQSTTMLRGIPRPLRTVVVKDEQDLIDIFDILYPYFGFQRSEELRFEEKGQRMSENLSYDFREYINGIPTPETLRIEIDAGLGIIVDIRGLLVLDRGFATTPAMLESEAIACGLNHVLQLKPSFVPRDGEHKAKVVYRWGQDRVLYPSWEVLLAYGNDLSQPPVYDGYLINHENEIVTMRVADHGPRPVPAACAE